MRGGLFLGALYAERTRTFRVEVAGHDGIHPDSSFSEFERQDFGNCIHRGLGRSIDGAVGCIPQSR